MSYCSSSSVVSLDFSALCVYLRVLEVRASSSPLGYLVPNFVSVARPTAELARREKSRTQSLTHSPSLFDAHGKEIIITSYFDEMWALQPVLRACECLWLKEKAERLPPFKSGNVTSSTKRAPATRTTAGSARPPVTTGQPRRSSLDTAASATAARPKTSATEPKGVVNRSAPQEDSKPARRGIPPHSTRR